MKKISLILILMTCLSSNAWEIEENNGVFLLRHEGVTTEVYSAGGMPRFLKEEKLTKRYSYLIYYSGTAGTYNPIKIQRAVVFDKKLKKNLGDYSYHYKSSGKHKSIPPIWKFDRDKMIIKITDKEASIEKTIQLK